MSNNSLIIWKRPPNETYEQRKQRILRPSQDNFMASFDLSKLGQAEGTFDS